MTTLKIITIIFVAFTWSRVMLRFNEKTLGYSSLLFWSGVWATVLVVVFNPQIADQTALFLKLQKGTDAMFFLSVILIFYLIFRLYIKLDLIDQQLSRLNEEVSKKIHRLTEKAKRQQ